MKFARHETFPFREGWIAKTFRKIEEGHHDVFTKEDAIEQLGIGSNMVRSLRYWMQAVGLTEEVKAKGKGQHLTEEFGQIIFDYDRYLEMDTSLWLLHYRLVSKKDWATTWYWFFNVFNRSEFDEEMFLSELSRWVVDQGEDVASGSLKRDYDCLLNMYVKNEGKNIEPEDNIGCPFQELGLIEPLDVRSKIFRLTRRNIAAIPSDVLLYMILDYAESKGCSQVSIEELYADPGSIGCVLALSYSDVISVLERLQNEGKLRLTRTAGLNQVVMESSQGAADLLRANYLAQRKGGGLLHG